MPEGAAAAAASAVVDASATRSLASALSTAASGTAAAAALPAAPGLLGPAALRLGEQGTAQDEEGCVSAPDLVSMVSTGKRLISSSRTYPEVSLKVGCSSNQPPTSRKT